MERIISYLANNFGKSFNNGINQEIVDLISALNREEITELRYRLFNEARRLDLNNNSQQAFFWLQNCLDIIGEYKFRMHRVFFSPGSDILDSISDLLQQAKKTLDICVFTITHEKLANDIINCYKRGVMIRLITDDDKLYDNGSEIKNIKHKGVAVKIDNSRYHMHHKFAVIDSRIAFTGSFNWTYTASKHNQENLLVTTNYDIVKQYKEQFNLLWNEMFDF